LFEFKLNLLLVDVTKEFRKYKKFEPAVCYFRKRNEYNVMPVIQLLLTM